MYGQWRKRIGKVRLGDLLERLVNSDGLGWPDRMDDELGMRLWWADEKNGGDLIR